MFTEQKILRIPGPTPIPPSVNQAMSQPMIGHRSPDFKQLLQEVRPQLKPIFGTQQDILILTGSGTSALETAVVNTLHPGDEVLVLVTGAFGQRFVEICQTYHLHVHTLESTWGEPFDLDAVEHYVQENPQLKAVLATYCETSTGVLNPVNELAQTIRHQSEAFIIVDGVSCVGAVRAQMDAWDIDILITGSQKAFMLPTGLAFMAVSERAWERIDANDHPRYYLDLRRYRQSLENDSTPFTPAVSLVMGLKQVLHLIHEEGFDNTVKRHQLLKNMTRAALQALQIPLLTEDSAASPTVTAIRPDRFEADVLRTYMKRHFQITLAGGQGPLKGEIFRIGHMGYCSALDVLQCISAIEMALDQMNVPIELGKGTQAAQEVYTHALSHTDQ